MPKYFWGAGEQLHYFQGFGEPKQNSFRKQRKIFSGNWAYVLVLFSGSKGALTPPGGLLEGLTSIILI